MLVLRLPVEGMELHFYGCKVHTVHFNMVCDLAGYTYALMPVISLLLLHTQADTWPTLGHYGFCMISVACSYNIFCIIIGYLPALLSSAYI